MCALSIQKGSEIVKNEHVWYTLERFPTDNVRVIRTKKGIRTLLSPTLNSLPASRFPFSFATSTTSSLNLVVYDFLRELPVLLPSMGNLDANF